MSLAALTGRTYGPIETRIIPERTAEFVAVTADDPDRWGTVAPPSYAAALLFSIAPRFIESPEIGDSTRVLVHTEQRFRWHGPLQAEVPVSIAGVVSRVRERGALSFVTFDCTVHAAGAPLVESTSTFLMGSDPAGEPGPDVAEPEVRAGSVADAMPASVEPASGAVLGPVRRGASRLDLVRYASASGDFNPVHFDHDAARRAGLDGVVVHGLLMAAWMGQLAASVTRRPDPLVELRLRFRSALRPGEVAVLDATVKEVTPAGIELAMALRSGGADLVTAGATSRREVTA